MPTDTLLDIRTDIDPDEELSRTVAEFLHLDRRDATAILNTAFGRQLLQHEPRDWPDIAGAAIPAVWSGFGRSAILASLDDPEFAATLIAPLPRDENSLFEDAI